jgi:hypothetical protein
MKALSIRQPWAWAIFYAGKRIENRTWSTNYRGPLLIHAARGMTSREYCDAVQFMIDRKLWPERAADSLLLYPDCWKRGGIVGKCWLDRVIEPGQGLGLTTNERFYKWWDPNQYGWVLDKVEPLPFHPCRGRQGLFEVELCH